MTRTDVAVDRFQAGYNCAQAVLYSLSDDLQLDRDTALKLACGFGAGMGRKQEVCGAISGGILAISLKYGRGDQQDRSSTEETYSRVRELMTAFELQHGTSICRALLNGCDLNTPEGMRYAKEHDLFNTVCKSCVKTVVDALDGVI